MDFTYLQPPRQAYKIKKLKQDQFEIIDGRPYRKIYQNVKYHDQQLQYINVIKTYLKDKQPNKLYQDSFLLKMVYLTLATQTSSNINNLASSMSSNNNPHNITAINPINVYENIKKHQQWFQNPQVITDRNKQSRMILQQGVVYSYGRDNQYSPVIYVHPGLVNMGKYTVVDYYNALYTLLEPIEQYMLVPGVNEGVNVVIDMEQSKYTKASNSNSNLPVNTVKEVIQKLVFAYPYRLKRLFFVNFHNNKPQHQNSNTYSSTITKCLTQTLKHYNYQSKPIYITKLQQFRRYIPDEQRQQRYGGNLDNLIQYWPISLATKFQQEKSYFLIENDSETDYKSVMNQDVFFQGVQANQGFCGNYCGKKNCEIY